MKTIKITFTNGETREYKYEMPDSKWIKKIDNDCEKYGLTVDHVEFE